MLIELDEFETKMFKNAEEIIKKTKTIELNSKTYVSYDELTTIISNLIEEYQKMDREFKDYVQNVDDNYRQISQAEQYDVSDRDFI